MAKWLGALSIRWSRESQLTFPFRKYGKVARYDLNSMISGVTADIPV